MHQHGGEVDWNAGTFGGRTLCRQFDKIFPLGYHSACWDSGCLRVTPQPNTGTGVRFPGEPVAVMAERFFMGGL